jgi:thiol-disulfide isomerase/thioredoxin
MTALVSGVALALAAATVHVQPPQALSPEDCVRQAREHTIKRQQELRPMTGEKVRQIDAERVKLLRDCGAAFDVDSSAVDRLPALVEFYADSQQPELVERALARGLAAADLPVSPRADLLVQAVRAGLRRRPKPDFAKVESYSDALDRLPEAVLDQKIAAHGALNGYYRGDDVDAGIIKHSIWLIETGKTLAADLRRKYGATLTAAYVNLAEAVAGQGENERALDLLRRAPVELADVPKAEERVKPALARYLLVGKQAAAVAAPVWLNRADTATPIDLKAKVTLLQFTAHWCGPCKESYPGTKRLLERFRDRGFQVVFYTRTYGHFEGERNLARDVEIERDRTYFAGYGFTHPIAIGSPALSVIDGKLVPQGEDPVEESYGVGGIPQINVIDAQGNLRLIMIGYDDANEEKLASFIEGLLKKRRERP